MMGWRSKTATRTNDPPGDDAEPQPPSPGREGAKHSLVEDIFAFAIGCSFIVLGLVFLKSAGLVTGGTAGIALLLSYVAHLPVGVLFVLLNLPFFLFARSAMGARFMIKTIIINLAIMGLTPLAPLAFKIRDVQPLFAALFGGAILGMGILALARHGAGVGGTGILALYLQRQKGVNAGKTQLAADALILSSSFLVLDAHRILLSALSAAVMSAVLISYHKPDRYKGY
jgi:uncharacterized membrane-anchored protein YitT (DUF2179 family)